MGNLIDFSDKADEFLNTRVPTKTTNNSGEKKEGLKSYMVRIDKMYV